MEFFRRVYALYAVGDKAIRYIGQTENLDKRFIQHTRFEDASRSMKSYWIANCHLKGIPVRVRTLEVVSASDYETCRRVAIKREQAWIRSATERGVRLLNSRLFEKWGAPKSVILTWEWILAHWFREFKKCGKAPSIDWKIMRILHQIEKDYPELDLENSRYRRMYRLPLSA